MMGPAGLHRSMPIANMEPTALERFVAPKNFKQKLQGKGLISSVGIALKYLSDMIFVKFNRFKHKLITGESITNKLIRNSLEANISVLRRSEDLHEHLLVDQNDFNKSIMTRTWIHHSITQMRHLCDHMIEKGMNKDKMEPIIEDLAVLEEVNDANAKTEVDTFKRYEQAEIEAAQKPIMLPRKQALAKEVLSLIRQAKAVPLIYGDESIGTHTGVDPYIMVSLGQTYGKNSSDNKKLSEIEARAKFNFAGLDDQATREEIETLIELITKAFTQAVSSKVEVQDIMGYKHHIRVKIPASEKFLPEAQHLIRGIDALQKLTLSKLGSD